MSAPELPRWDTWEQFEEVLYKRVVTRMIEEGYIEKQWTPEERQRWLDNMVMKNGQKKQL